MNLMSEIYDYNYPTLATSSQMIIEQSLSVAKKAAQLHYIIVCQKRSFLFHTSNLLINHLLLIKNTYTDYKVSSVTVRIIVSYY